MGILMKDENEQSTLSSRIASEMKRKLEENSIDEADKPTPVEEDVENSAYMEDFDNSKRRPFFWKIFILIALASVIVLAFIFIDR